MSRKWRLWAWCAVVMTMVGAALTGNLLEIMTALQEAGHTRLTRLPIWGVGGVVVYSMILSWHVARARHAAFGELRVLTAWLYIHCLNGAVMIVKIFGIWLASRLKLEAAQDVVQTFGTVYQLGRVVMGLLALICIAWTVGWLVTRPFKGTGRTGARNSAP